MADEKERTWVVGDFFGLGQCSKFIQHFATVGLVREKKWCPTSREPEPVISEKFCSRMSGKRTRNKLANPSARGKQLKGS